MAQASDHRAQLGIDLDHVPADPDRHASDSALAVIDSIETQSVSVDPVREYASTSGESDVATKHLLRILQLCDGRLALVTWSSAGITAIGYRPTEQRYEIGQFSGIDKRMGKDPESHERVSRSEARDMLSWATPTIVTREDSKLLDDIEVVA